MRKDQKYPRTRLDDTIMSMFSHVIWLTVLTVEANILGILWTNCSLTLSWIRLYNVVNLWISIVHMIMPHCVDPKCPHCYEKMTSNWVFSCLVKYSEKLRLLCDGHNNWMDSFCAQFLRCK